jgi:hypothetical protein
MSKAKKKQAKRKNSKVHRSRIWERAESISQWQTRDIVEVQRNENWVNIIGRA